jgi:hypothetical protein
MDSAQTDKWVLAGIGFFLVKSLAWQAIIG